MHARFYLWSSIAIFFWALFPLASSRLDTLSGLAIAFFVQCISLVVWTVILFAATDHSARGQIWQPDILKPLLISSGLNSLEVPLILWALQGSSPVASTISYEAWIIFFVAYEIISLKSQMNVQRTIMVALGSGRIDFGCAT